MKKKLPKVIAIVGPTASGKTACSIELAGAIGGEVVSADSRQVYRGLDIGSGKVTKREMRGIPHHLLDVASPKTVFTASDFEALGSRAIADIVSRGAVPIVVGGTGFYVDSLLGEIVLPDVPPDPALRARLADKSAAQLFAQLRKLDPKRARTIDAHNPHRLIRAIEIAEALGTNPPRRSAPRYDVLWLGIDVPHDTLASKIRTRLLARIRQGMLNEAQKLHARGLSYRRMEALGLEYRYMARLLGKKMSRAQFQEQLEQEIIRYAKRQMTWFRKNKKIVWIGSAKEALARTRNFLGQHP